VANHRHLFCLARAPPPKVRPGLEGKDIDRVVNIPSQNLKVYRCHRDPRIRVYKNDAGGEPLHVFEQHVTPGISNRRVYLSHLYDDLMVSMRRGGNVITWVAGSGKVLDTFNVAGSLQLRKLNAMRLTVTRKNGAIVVLEHMKGKGISQLREILIGTRNIICTDGNDSVLALVLSNGKNRTTEIWNYMTGTKLHSFEVGYGTDYVDLSDEFVAVSNRQGGISTVFENGGSYTCLSCVDFATYLPTVRPPWHTRITRTPQVRTAVFALFKHPKISGTI